MPTNTSREFEFLITRSKPFYSCATLTAVDFLKTLGRTLGIYMSPLTFDWGFLVEIFETDLNNAHMSSGASPFTALCANCNCLYFTSSVSGSQFNGFKSESLRARYSVCYYSARLCSFYMRSSEFAAVFHVWQNVAVVELFRA